MKRALIALLLCLAAQPVHADHIWRLWCGNPATARRGSYDTSAECQKVIESQVENYADHCVDTNHGMVWKEDGSPIPSPSDIANCRAGHDEWNKCFCKAE